jgi:hypothetical protein
MDCDTNVVTFSRRYSSIRSHLWIPFPCSVKSPVYLSYFVSAYPLHVPSSYNSKKADLLAIVA